MGITNKSKPKRVSNVNRKATANALLTQLKALESLCGLVIQTHRAYESPSKNGAGYTQKEVADYAGTKQEVVSKLENGKAIPDNDVLKKILEKSGFDLSRDAAGQSFLGLLQFIRDNSDQLSTIDKEKPK